jgi:ribosomal protein S4E
MAVDACSMTTKQAAARPEVKDGERCAVVRGNHAGKSGTVRDVKTSASGHVTITVVQKDGQRFKTLARNVLIESDRRS